MFKTEARLVDQFVNFLNSGDSCYGNLKVEREWNHKAGNVDVLAVDCNKRLVAFEAKLTNWKKAFDQAYKSTGYANEVYVLLPEKVVHRAFQAQREFEQQGIGLCSFDGVNVTIHIEAREQEPILTWLRDKALKDIWRKDDGSLPATG